MVATSGSCLGWLCFAPLSSTTPVFFGFGEYLAGLALMVLAWTIADARYRFRIATAPLPMDRLTFWVVAAVGVLVLLTDLWRAEAWPVLVGPMPPALWQGLLGGAFLMTFLAWAWFGFIRPPRYGRWNAKRYADSLYRIILKGSPPQLAIAADELARSAEAIVKNAPSGSELRSGQQQSLPDVAAYANEILLLIADRRFCRVVVASAPGTIGSLFQAIRESKKYGVHIDLFGRNVVREAIRNRDSFLYHESSGYASGLLGYLRPVTTVMFADFGIIDANALLLDPGYFEAKKWAADQWEAYAGVVLTALKAYAERGLWWGRGLPFSGPLDNLEHAVQDLYKLDGVASASWEDDIQARLRAVVDFIQEALKILEEVGVPEGLRRRVEKSYTLAWTFYDQLAELAAKVIFEAAAVTGPPDLCWWIQHNTVWSELTWHSESRRSAWGTVLFKVRRRLYDDVVELSSFPNFKGARILGFCLNVMGFEEKEAGLHREMRPLHKAVLRWTKTNFARLYAANPRVAEACLVAGMSYDLESARLVRTYPAEGLRLEVEHVYLDIEPSKSGRKKRRARRGSRKPKAPGD